jgi:hypothetical protein
LKWYFISQTPEPKSDLNKSTSRAPHEKPQHKAPHFITSGFTNIFGLADMLWEMGLIIGSGVRQSLGFRFEI